MRFWRAKSTLANATRMELALVRTSTTMVAYRRTTPETAPKRLLGTVRGKAPGRTTMLMLVVPRSVLRAKAEEASGRVGAPGGDVIPCQTVEAETDERSRHRPPAMRVMRGMAAPTPTALNKSEAISVDRRSHARDEVSRKPICSMGMRRHRRSPSVHRDSRIWLTTTTLVAIKR
jgi:hypothetical protein